MTRTRLSLSRRAFGFFLNRSSNINSVIKRFRSDIDAVRPSERSTIQEKLGKKLGVFECLKYWTLEPLRDIDVLFGTVVKAHSNNKASHTLSSINFWQVLHGYSQLSGSIRFKGLPCSMFFQFSMSSNLCSKAHSRTHRLARRDEISPLSSSPLNPNVAFSP